MNIHLLYFASLSETLGIKTEIINTDLIEPSYADTATTKTETLNFTVAKLKTHLATRGKNWQIFLSNNNLLCAVNQTMATSETLIEANQEVAFFPPVTGG